MALRSSRSLFSQMLMRSAVARKSAPISNVPKAPLLQHEGTSGVAFFRGLATKTSDAPTTVRVRRRKRPNTGKAKPEGTGPPKRLPEKTGLDAPYSYGGEDGTGTEEYLKKTSLSPWVPIPDPVARKLFDMSAPTPEDIHVDLGCGDGRVNFYAIDHGKVKKSTGIDIDEGILEKAQERLEKRFPQPPIEFLAADLMDYDNDEVWSKIQEATIITMYFVDEALQKIRPILEEKLAGKQCKIITCAYEMKGWNFTVMETTLGTTVYLYNWNKDSTEEEDGGSTPFFEDEMLIQKPREMLKDPLDALRSQGSTQDVKHTESIWSLIPDPNQPDPNDSWTDDEEEDDKEEDEDAEPAASKSGSTKKKTPCSRS